ncbi:heme-copper oxidase subunit III [Crocosphaera sp. UHCC 0190]|uniref:cytochrome c oxidase subunit 3 n=1 Tax=Crocosphaera sp. UHCC 0190 TaxID=3110246 RepID=UPI002B1FB0ED|nr:heme-copper oxidase subunit III [Crocosphaera sp. UHCC 0190]MEA5508742.1 heme-copper oxidase subunit III [Crocosphaera sp. UHCC 0190]
MTNFIDNVLGTPARDTREGKKGNLLFGVTVFLLSESMVFVSFFLTYIILRLSTKQWLPSGVLGPQLSITIIINTIVLLSSSLVIYLAERAIKKYKLVRFRLLWLTTSVMGTYFLVGTFKEWQGLDFGLSTGLVGATFYLFTGFHALHIIVGIFLQMLMLVRSFVRGNYNRGHYGVISVSLFWHFVDGIWIILFSLLYLWQAKH